jgi:TrmH family RNA methyltransferase
MSDRQVSARLEIRSPSSERFRRLLALSRSSREREALGLAIVEGEHLLEAWLDAGGSMAPEAVIPRRSSKREAILALCERAAHQTLVLDDALFDRLSQVVNGPGPLVTIPIPQASLPEALDQDAVFLDGIQDPGNAGTLLRSAAAFGVRLIVSSPDSVSLWSPKVVRAGMGAHFALQICEAIPVSSLISVRGAARWTAAAPRSPRSIDEADLRGARVWIFGAEGKGLSAELSAMSAIDRLEIRHEVGIESLNVGVAASICLYEQFTQRQAAARR